MRTAKSIFTLLAAMVILSTMAGPASAGGNWIEWKRRYNVAGKVVVARNIFFARSEASVRQKGPYYAYITPQTYGWQLPNVDKPGTIRLGRVKVIWPGRDSHFKGFRRFNPRARIRFTVPDLPSGHYLITFCNLGCTHTLGDVDPTGGFSIVQSALEGRLTRRLNQLHYSFREYRSRAARARDRVERELADEIGELGRDAYVAKQRIGTLDEQLSKLRRDLRADESLPWAAFAGAGMIFGLAGFVAGSLRRRRLQRKAMDVELRQIIEASGEAQAVTSRRSKATTAAAKRTAVPMATTSASVRAAPGDSLGGSSTRGSRTTASAGRSTRDPE